MHIATQLRQDIAAAWKRREITNEQRAMINAAIDNNMELLQLLINRAVDAEIDALFPLLED